ncbi:LamB/YcsF family protein, partial [Microbacterium testaceum]|uniref:LamB/YcsF family protein n=1 Tax=Microbacterium testaceum TaxID=2033 RepID=UPI000AD5ACB4
MLGLPGAVVEAAASAGLPFVHEAFLDRGYTAAGGLVPRGTPGALIDDPARVAERALRLVRDGEVETVDGDRLNSRA